MTFYRKRKPFISLVCVFSLLLSILSISVDAAGTNRVTASTTTTVRQGNSAYAYVYIDSTKDLSSLEVAVHFDPAKVKITNVYNSVGCVLYDSTIHTDSIQMSYILDGKGTTSKTRLFYFQYQALSNAEAGDTYFDIIIGEAFDPSLQEMTIDGSRCKFAITEAVTSKSCSVYSSSSIPTAIGQEFTLSYRFSTSQITSGLAIITYDPELFEVVTAAEGGFLAGKVADINTDLAGEIYVSFVGTEYNSDTYLVTVTFKTIKNVTETSKITLKTPELWDKELNSISCSGYTTSVNIAYDTTYTGDAPAMRLDGTFSYENKQVTLVVSLEAGSNLGAGDFIISFDPELVSYDSCTKGFSPDFFLINDKDAAAGKLKFHIISTSDIVTEETVLTVVFDVNHPYECETADFTLDGTGLTDSLTESVLLNFIDDSVWLEYRVVFLDADGTILQSSMYHYGDVVQEPDVPTKESDVYGTYSFAGWDKPVTACTADATYTATYDLEYTDYTVAFRNWDGTVLSSKTYHYGDTVEIPADPTRETDSTYIYIFTGWDKDVVTCNGNATYTATYSPAYGYCGSEGPGTNLIWGISPDGTLTISGTGAMASYNSDAAPWCTKYDTMKNVKKVIIGDQVTTIGSCAFNGCANLTDVYFEGNAPAFGRNAFKADTVTLYCIPGTTGWTDSDAYNAAAGTWNGYKLASWGVEEPDLSNVTISHIGNSLSLESIVYINQYAVFTGDVNRKFIEANGGLLIWKEEPEAADISTADMVKEGLTYEASIDAYRQSSDGIPAKEFSDELYMAIYVGDAAGNYAYGPVWEYSVQDYCENRLRKSTDAEMKALAAAMLHYGAAAQTYFKYNTGDLANANIAEQHPAEEWDGSLLDAVVNYTSAPESSGDVTVVGYSLSLEGTVLINYYFNPAADADWTVASAKMQVWEDVLALTEDNIAYEAKMTYGPLSSSFFAWGGQSEGVVAKEYGKTMYVRAVMTDTKGNVHTSDVIAYSPEAYAKSRIFISTNAAMINLAKHLVMYGECARVYFG